MRQKIKNPGNIIVIGICLEILFMFANRNEYFQLSGWYYPLIISVLAGVLPVTNNVHRIKKFSVLALLFLLLICCSAIVNINMINSGYALSYALSLVILFIFSELDFEKKQLDRIAICYGISGLIITFSILFFRVRYYELTTSRLTIQFLGGPKIDPNYLGGYLVSAATISIAYSMIADSKKIKLFFILSYLISTFGTLLTGSRGALIALIIVTFFFILDRSRKSAISFLVIVAFLIIGYLFIHRYLSSDTLTRLSNISEWLSDGSNVRRFSLWKNAWNSIRKSPILGYGMAGTKEINEYAGNIGQPAHCTYLEMWCQLGIFSLVILLLMAISIFKYKNKTSFLILLATFIPAIFISAECGFCFFFNIAFSYSICELQLHEKEKINETQMDSV